MLLILFGLNWWLKPIEYHPKNLNSCFSCALKLLIRPTAIREHQSFLPSTPRLAHDFTPLSSDNNSDRIVGYYQLAKSDPSSSDKIDTSSGKETTI